MKVFFIDLLTSNIDLQAYQSFLSADEKARSNRITSISTKRNFICGRALIKTTLAKMLSCQAQDVILKTTENGRLEIDSPCSELRFNLSHSNNYIVLGVSPKPIGIDIEYIKNRNYLDIAEYFFTQKEFESLKNISHDVFGQRLFYYYWTAKEAFIKCNGATLFDKSLALECLVDISAKIIKHNFNQEYQLLTMHFNQDYVVSIAAKEFIPAQEFIEVRQIIDLESGAFITRKINIVAQSS